MTQRQVVRSQSPMTQQQLRQIALLLQTSQAFAMILVAIIIPVCVGSVLEETHVREGSGAGAPIPNLKKTPNVIRLQFNSEIFSRRHDNQTTPIRPSDDRGTTGDAGISKFSGPIKTVTESGSAESREVNIRRRRGMMTWEQFHALVDVDAQRFARRKLLRQNISGVRFGLGGNADPQVAGLYYATIDMGTPPQQFRVQIDTGSDLLWVACEPCTACATSSDITSLSRPFSIQSSSTNRVVQCNTAACPTFNVVDNVALGCAAASLSSDCHYLVQYADGSSSYGHLVTDALRLSGVESKAARITFGCGFNQTGNLVEGGQTVDGVMGLGLGSSSIISQLASGKFVEDAFAHCLGGEEGGGLLVLGRSGEADMQYTKLLKRKSGTQYYAALEDISIGNKSIDVDAQDFGSPSSGGGTILDSGTSLAFLVDTVFQPFTLAITKAVTYPQVDFSLTDGRFCYDISSSPIFNFLGSRSWPQARNTFPDVVLHFVGGARMVLPPENYLLRVGSSTGEDVACLAWDSSKSGLANLSVLGGERTVKVHLHDFACTLDLTMRNMWVEFDREKETIGWKAANCSQDTNIERKTSTHVPQSTNVPREEEMNTSSTPTDLKPHTVRPRDNKTSVDYIIQRSGVARLQCVIAYVVTLLHVFIMQR